MIQRLDEKSALGSSFWVSGLAQSSVTVARVTAGTVPKLRVAEAGEYVACVVRTWTDGKAWAPSGSGIEGRAMATERADEIVHVAEEEAAVVGAVKADNAVRDAASGASEVAVVAAGRNLELETRAQPLPYAAGSSAASAVVASGAAGDFAGLADGATDAAAAAADVVAARRSVVAYTAQPLVAAHTDCNLLPRNLEIGSSPAARTHSSA